MTRPEMSVQLYSLRSRLDEELDEVLGALAGIGLTAVEPFDLAGWAPRLAPLLAGHGLRAPTAHVSLVGVDVEPALAAAHLLGTRTVIEPFVPQERWTTRDDIAAIARELGDVAARAADRGLTVGYHNHWWETALRVDGSPALEVLADLLEDRVLLEVDVYWAAVGGEDPAGLLRRLGERVVALHLKDGPLTHDVTAQQPAGHGELDVPDVLAAAPDARLVLEFDEYVGDMVEGLAASRRTVLGLEGVA